MSPLLLCILLFAIAARANPCTTNGLASSYDVVVVGAGIGGAVTARRLAERNPGWSILVIERGPEYTACPECIPASLTAPVGKSILNNPNTGVYITTPPQPGMENTRANILDAAIIGGATTVNGMEHTRGNAEYYFDTYFPISWDWQIMKFFHQQYESYHYPAGFYGPLPNFSYAANYRGRNGPVDVTQEQGAKPYFDATIGVYPNIAPYSKINNTLNNGNNPGIGSSSREYTMYNGVRSSSYTSYLQGYTGSNIKQIVRTRVNKILFNSKKEATGVQIVSVAIPSQKANSGTCNVNAKNIIIASGAIGTPKLLKLSGIGPSEELTAHGIPVIVNNANVGANLDDHVTMIAVMTPLPGASNYILWNPQDNPNGLLTVQHTISYLAGGLYGPIVSAHYLSTRGTVTLASSNPDDSPVVDPHYFENANDKLQFAIAFNKSLTIAQNLGMRFVVDPCVFPGATCSTPLEKLNTYIKGANVPGFGQVQFWAPGYHYTGTAALCKVVNSVDLSVKGVKNLFVVDASVLPRSPGGNTMANTYALAERGADVIEASIKLPGQLGHLFPHCI